MENQKKLQVKVGGLSCSFCAETIRKAYSRIGAVSDVNVSLAHEEVLVQYNQSKITETELKETLRQLGYTVHDSKETSDQIPIALSLKAETVDISPIRDNIRNIFLVCKYSIK